MIRRLVTIATAVIGVGAVGIAAGCSSGKPHHPPTISGFSVSAVAKAFRQEGLVVAETHLVTQSDRQPVVGALFGYADGLSFDVEVYRSAQVAKMFAATSAPPAKGETEVRRRRNVLVWLSPASAHAKQMERVLRRLR